MTSPPSGISAAIIFGFAFAGIALASDAPDAAAPRTIPFDQLGAEAQKQYQGEGISITPTSAGARLRAAMQDLEGAATPEGLWLTSVADEDAGKANRFRVRAITFGRDASIALPVTGAIHTTKDCAALVRPGLIEEYRVSTDGVRQDFVILQRPVGREGLLRVTLDITGAKAETESYGAKLTVTETDRELAYSRLVVTDATGRHLTAQMSVEAADRLRIEVEDAGAVYPVRIDPTFSDADWISIGASVPGVDGTVYALAVNGSGHLFVGGAFAHAGSVAASRIAKWNGSAWEALGSGLNQTVSAIVVSGSDVYVGGSFTTAGGVAANRIAKWNGTTWSALGSGMNEAVIDLAMFDGALHACGSFTTAGGVSANRIAKWNGTSWSALGTGLDNRANVLFVYGSLYVGGAFITAGGTTVNRVARWTGTTWVPVGSGLSSGDVRALGIHYTGLIAGGSFPGYVACWDGSYWSTMTGLEDAFSSEEGVYSILVDDTDLYVGGLMRLSTGNYCGIARWNGLGWWANSVPFNHSGESSISTVRAMTAFGGNLYVGGQFNTAGGVAAVGIARTTFDSLASGGAGTWTAFPGSGLNDAVLTMAVSGTDLYVGGYFTKVGDIPANYVAKWNGSTWSSLGSGVDRRVHSLLVSGSDLYVGGGFYTAGGVSARCIARWNGTSWSALGSGMDGPYVFSLATMGGYIYAGGDFENAGGVSARCIARWNGTAWSTVGTGMTGPITGAVDVLKVVGTDLYAGGAFTTAGGVSANRIARWNGASWSSLGSGVNSTVFSIETMGNDLYAGGYFWVAGGVNVNGVAKWNGSAWSALGTGNNGSVKTLKVHGSTLFVGGTFTTFGGVQTIGLARWDGTAWSGVPGAPGNVESLEVIGNEMYVGGFFQQVGGKLSPRLARLDLTALTVSLASASAITGTTATLNGVINPRGEATTAHFEYGLDTSYGSTATVTLTPDNGTADQAVSALISGLDPGTTYHYRLVTSSASGVKDTADGSFTTLSNNASLSGLVLSAGSLSPAFSSAQFTYAATAPVGSITVTPTVSAAGATVTVDGISVSSGSPSGSISLAAGANVISVVVTAPDGVTTETYTLEVTRALPAEIAVEQPSGTDLTDDSGTPVSFGPVVAGEFGERTFTIRNLGDLDLTGLTISIDGDDAAQFAVTLEPVAPVAGESDIPFTVQFTPESLGTKGAVLHIASNDANESPFDIKLSGSGVPRPPGSVDSSFDVEVDGNTITALALQPDGKSLIGGTFLENVQGVPRDVARLHTDGTLDTTFRFIEVDAFVDGDVSCMAVQSDGKVIIGGNFTSVGGFTRKRLARLFPDGTLDVLFDPKIGTSNGSDVVNCLALQPDGKILVGGAFSVVHGVARTNIARLRFDGELDPSFDASNQGVEVNAIALQPDGKIVIGGNFLGFGAGAISTVRNNIARLLPTGAVDASFNPNADVMVHCLALQPDGKILVGGLFNSIGGAPRKRFARLLPGGSVDGSFADLGIPNFWVDSVALQADGKIILGGIFSSVAGSTRENLARVDANGTLDTAFAPDPDGRVEAIALQNDGQILLGGVFGSVDGASRLHFARLINDPAPQSLAVTGPSRVEWMRDGSAPEVLAVTFELSTNGGTSWTSLGAGTRISGGWEKTGLNLPLSGIVRGRSRVSSGQYNGSSSLIESSLEFTRVPDIFVSYSTSSGSGGSIAALTDGASTVHFSGVPSDGERSLTFTIANTGNDTLAGLGVSIDGTHASAFSVTAQPDTSLADGAHTTFTVRFKPGSQGSKNAVLRISSNDPDEAPFDCILAGIGTPAIGTLSLSAASYEIDENHLSGEKKVTIIRNGGSSGQISVKLTTANGTALAGSDYTALPVNVEYIIANGQTSVDIAIPIANTLPNETNETFTVTLSNPTGGAHLGSPSSAIVTIVEPSALTDPTAPPPPKISQPVANAFVGVDSQPPDNTVTITGTATDNKGVKRVLVSLDGVNFTDAALALPGAPVTTFAGTITPETGSNTVHVKTEDFAHHESPVVIRTFNVIRPLEMNIAGSSGSVTTGFTPSPSFREPGKSYTITATPATGSIFTHWIATGVPLNQLGLVPAALQKQSLTFIFREGLVLTANFAPNPYDGTVTGTYTGLIQASPDLPDRSTGTDGSVPGLGTEGGFTATVTSTGAFSGKLTIDGLVLNVAGVFDHEGRARFGTARVDTLAVPRAGKPSLVVKFDIGGPPGSAAPAGQITGTVTAMEFLKGNPASVSNVVARRAHFTGLAGFVVPDEYLTVTGASASPAGRSDGVFTVALPSLPLGSQPARVSDVLTELDYPKGDGIGTLRITKAGTVTLTATLADGTAVTAAGSLSQDLRAALFARLYTLKGFLSAPIQLDHADPDSDLTKSTGGEVLWCRPFNSASHFYPYGWRETIELDLVGAKYVAAAGQNAFRAPDGVDGGDAGDPLQAPDANGNVTLTFDGGHLSESIVKSVNLSSADAVAKIPSNDPTFTMTVNRTTGIITGVFDHIDDTKPAYNAIIFQKGPNAGARGYFLTKQPVPIDYTGESGHVLIQGVP